MKKFLSLLSIALSSFLVTSAVYAAATILPLPQGGTGSNDLSRFSIITSGSATTSALIATSSNPLWVGSIQATTTSNSTLPNLLVTNSTTTNATSTNLFATTASSTNLFGSIGRLNSLGIGIGTTTNGTLETTANIYGAGTLSITGNVSLGTVTQGTWKGTNIGTGNGGTGVATFGGTNRLLYTTATDVLSSIITANSSILVTDSGGIPSWGTTLPAHTLGGAVTGNNQNITGINLMTLTSGTSTNFFTTTASSTNLFGSVLSIGKDFKALTVSATGPVGVGTSTPFGLFSINQSDEANSLWLGHPGSTTPSLVIRGVNGNGFVGIATTTPANTLKVQGHIASCEQSPATTTSITLDWSTTCNQIRIPIGTAAVTITQINYVAGDHKMIWICNPNSGTAGTVTWSPLLRNFGTAPVQTTTANQCDLWSEDAAQATSTGGNPTISIWTSVNTGAQ